MLRLLLPLTCVALALLALDRPPVLDEEVYLDIGAQLADHPLRPYDWWRPMQPWGATRPKDAYLFAHPPLHLGWVAGWQALLGFGPALRAAVTLPLAGLLGLAVAELALAWSRRPGLAAALWISSPVVVLALQSGLMPDLGVVAWATAAVAAHQRGARGSPGWSVAAGALLGVACGWKYPALVLLPLLLASSPHRLALLGGFGVVWGGLELALWAEYGRPHLLVVIAQAPRIDRGPLEGRAWGTLLRLGLALGPVALLARPRWALLGAGVVAAVGLPRALGASMEFTPGQQAGAALWLFAGLGLLGVALGGARRLPARWALLALAAVVVGHNYASARYLLPALAPLAVLLADRARWPALAWGGAVLWGGLALALSRAETRQAEAAVEVAGQLAAGVPPGRFTGEWSFRWKMRALGWTFHSPGEPLAPGERLAAPTVSSPAELPPLLLPLRAVEAGEGWLRLVDPAAGVGYPSETLGPLPVGLGKGPLEQGRLYEVP